MALRTRGAAERRGRGEGIADVDQEIGSIARPKHMWIVRDMPKTRSGRIMRRVIAAVSNFADISDITTLAKPQIVDAIRHRVRSEKRAPAKSHASSRERREEIAASATPSRRRTQAGKTAHCQARTERRRRRAGAGRPRAHRLRAHHAQRCCLLGQQAGGVAEVAQRDERPSHSGRSRPRLRAQARSSRSRRSAHRLPGRLWEHFQRRAFSLPPQVVDSLGQTITRGKAAAPEQRQTWRRGTAGSPELPR